MEKRRESSRGMMLVVPVILIFCILGGVVFFVAKKTSEEMSAAAIDNLGESLDLIEGTVEALLQNEVKFQKMLAEEIAVEEDIEGFICSYSANEMFAKISIVETGEKEGISNTGEVFSPDELDFSLGKMVDELCISGTYVNDMGTWAYTIKSPVVKGTKKIADLYVEYMYSDFDQVVPGKIYKGDGALYIMDTKTQRLVLKPRGVGEWVTGHLNLEDFYRANNILETEIQENVAVNIEAAQDVMFYHEIQGKESLIYLWEVNDGAMYLVGYVPVEAIQKEASSVNRSILIVAAVMLAAFLSCCMMYFVYTKKQNDIRREQEAERELYNRQLAEALRAAQIASESKTTFLSNMSHDIRTPMNAVLGFTTLLEKDAEDPEKVRKYAKRIETSGQHLLGLINDILDISKIESGKVVLTMEEFSLNELISAVDSIIRSTAKERKQQFDVTVTGIRYDNLLGDETRIRQILINLLSNAVKYTPEGGNISLRVTGLESRSSQYEHIRIEVEDDGIGMTPEYQKIIFDAFTREENSTTNKIQGTGLGMAITKSIVDLMGGIIKVSSQVNKGTCFTVELELRIPDVERKPQEKVIEDKSGSLQGRKFLVAEDNEINAEILTELLHMEGASCEIVSNGQLVVERFKTAETGEYDAILMDVQMPVMDGYEATRAIRALSRKDAKKILIIAMTANAFAEDVKNAMDAGMNAHVPKPIDIGLLKKTLNQYM